MNREIKFRAWVPKDESRIFANQESYMAVQGTPDNETLQSFMFHYGDEPLLMQYTGLKDKNGKEIYEGDVVRQFGTNTEVVFMVGAFGYIVNKNEPYAMFIPFGSNNHYDWVADKSDEIEVIGNIYETPQLLNKDLEVQECDARNDE